MYHGQFDPPVDALIERFFPAGAPGSCVEVGAVDGVYLSNTYYFEQLGWQCLCIEPNTYYHQALRKNRKLVLPYAISSKNVDNVVLHRVKTGDSYDAATGLELDPRLIEQAKTSITAMDDILVPMRTLDFALEEVGWTGVDFVSIDTEGTELDALKGLDLNRWNPKLLIIENNFNAPEIENYLDGFGYMKLIRHYVNDFYIKPDPA